MTTWLKRATFALLLMSVTPATASAQFWDIVKWINDMSGPQMLGYVYEQPVWCRYDSGTEKLLLACTPFRIDSGRVSTDRRSLYLGARVGRTWNTKQLEGDTSVRDISMFVIGPTVRWSPSAERARALRSLDVTAGVELVRFYGPTVDDFWVTTADLGVTFRPVGLKLPDHRLSHFYSIALTYKQFLETFGGDRFGAPNSFLSTTEGMWQFTFARFDFGSLIFR